MLNLTISSQANIAPKDPVSPANIDASARKQSENEQFNKILAREMSEKQTDKADTARIADKAADSTRTADTAVVEKITEPTEKSPTEPSNSNGLLLQTPENSAKLMPSNLPKKSFSFESDSNIPTVNVNEPLSNEVISPFTPDILSASPVNGPVAQFTNNQGQAKSAASLASNHSMQQNLARYTPYLNNYSSNGQQPNGAANSATFDQILPPITDARNTIFSNTEEALKFSSSEITQPTGLSNLSSTATSSTSATLIPQSLSIAAQVDQPKWGGEFAQKIVWLSSQQQHIAEIRLNPAHLGPVEVMLNITNDQASAQFVSSHPAVREAIEASLPKLREMLAENGITLGDVSVGAESFQQQADTRQNNKESSGYNTNAATIKGETMTLIETPITPNRHNGMVNTFA